MLNAEVVIKGAMAPLAPPGCAYAHGTLNNFVKTSIMTSQNTLNVQWKSS